MKKRIYISPSAFVCEISGRTVMATSMIVNGYDKVINDADIGFVNDYNSQIRDINLWDNEW